MKKINSIKMKIIEICRNILYLNKKINPSLLASSVTFYLILSLIPLVDLVYIILNYLEITNIEYVGISNSTFVTTVIFIINLLITSSKLIHNLTVVTDEIYFNVKNRSRFVLRIKSFFLTILLLLLVLSMIVGIIYVGYLKTTFFIKYNFIINSLQLILTIVFTILFISILYKKITPIKMKIKDTVFPSSIIAIIIYLLVILYQKIIKGILISKYEAVYGSFSSIITTLIFLYIASYIFIVGICFLLYKKEYK